MRITCPNCDAAYEVDEGAIPAEGRDVQCSNCGHAWFQERPDFAASLQTSLYDQPEPDLAAPDVVMQGTEDRPEPVAAETPRRTLDDAVLSVLREEAEREVSARKAEQQSLEMQGDLGLPPPVPTGIGSAAYDQRPFDDGSEDGATAARSSRPRPTARRDLLPDIEEINSTLKPGDRVKYDETTEPDADPRGKSGFRSGFTLMLLLAVLCVALYVMAPKISEQIPGLAGVMKSYVALVDAGRVALDGLIRKATGAVQGLTGGPQG